MEAMELKVTTILVDARSCTHGDDPGERRPSRMERIFETKVGFFAWSRRVASSLSPGWLLFPRYMQWGGGYRRARWGEVRPDLHLRGDFIAAFKRDNGLKIFRRSSS